MTLIGDQNINDLKDGDICPMISTAAIVVIQSSAANPAGTLINAVPNMQEIKPLAIPVSCYKEKCQLWDGDRDMCSLKEGK